MHVPNWWTPARDPCFPVSRAAGLNGATLTVPLEAERALLQKGAQTTLSVRLTPIQGGSSNGTSFWGDSRGVCAETLAVGLPRHLRVPRSACQHPWNVGHRDETRNIPVQRGLRRIVERADSRQLPMHAVPPMTKRPPPRLPAAVGRIRSVGSDQRRRRPARPARPRSAIAPGVGRLKVLVANCTAEPATPLL